MHISVLSLHTSPAAQPGQGDAGGMNVYVDQSVRALAAAGHVVDVFTADPGGIDGLGGSIGLRRNGVPDSDIFGGSDGLTRSTDPGDVANQGNSAAQGYGRAETLHIAENVLLHQLPIEAGSKDELADAIDELALLLLDQPSFVAADLIWAHYWISAEAALRSQELKTQESAEQQGPAPRIIASMHTIGAVKNRDSETSHERPQRLEAEERIASAVDLIIANTPAERRDLIHELGAESDSVVVARPGVDHELFSPGDKAQARTELGLDPEEFIVLYVGRMQFIKGTDVVVDAISGLRGNNPQLASRTRGILLGAVSGQPANGDANDGIGESLRRVTGSSPYMRELATAIAAEPSIEVRRPVPARELVTYYRAADILLVPSRSESFGLVAAEAAASGLPAVASAVGGLPDIVEHGCSGVLIADHNPRHWATALERMLLDDELRAELCAHALERSARFDWSATTATVLDALHIPGPELSTTVTTTEEPNSTASLVGRIC